MLLCICQVYITNYNNKLICVYHTPVQFSEIRIIYNSLFSPSSCSKRGQSLSISLSLSLLLKKKHIQTRICTISLLFVVIGNIHFEHFLHFPSFTLALCAIIYLCQRINNYLYQLARIIHRVFSTLQVIILRMHTRARQSAWVMCIRQPSRTNFRYTLFNTV